MSLSIFYVKADFVQDHCDNIGTTTMGFYSGRGGLNSTPNKHGQARLYWQKGRWESYTDSS